MRRTWMLLLVIALLAIFMAVPAMAAEDTTYCLCGYTKDGTSRTGHASWCDEEDHDWQPLTDANVTKSGYYYVPEGLELTGQIKLNSSSAASKITVVLDLNGTTLSAATGSRCFLIYHTDFSITDSSTNDNNVGNGRMEGGCSSAHSGLLQFATGSTMNIYAGTLTLKSGVVVQNYAGLFQINHTGAVVNMYGGTLTGGNATGVAANVYVRAGELNIYGGTISNGVTTNTSGGGGNIRIHSSTGGGTVNMYGGTISGGTATMSGGSISIGYGTFNMYGGTITGGTTSADGGTVYIGSTGTFNFEGGTIIGGTATGNGGAVYIAGALVDNNTNYATLPVPVTVTTPTITGGEAENGGSVYLSVDSFTMDGLQINGGTATENGGAVCVPSGTITIQNTTITGGTSTKYGGAVYVEAGTLNLQNTATISGGNAVAGGNILTKNAVLNINGGTVSGGTSSKYGGNVYVSGGELNMYNGTISGGQANASKGYGGNIYMASGAVKMYGGTITGGHTNETNGRGGNIYMDGGRFDMYGGTISCGLTDESAINAERGGAMYIGADATFNMNKPDGTHSKTAGLIDACRVATNGGNLFVAGNVNMEAGTIQNGKSGSGGGNIRMVAGSYTFNMTGGTISGGTASAGEGIDLYSGTFQMSGGKITGAEGAVYARGGGTIKLSGSAQITGNTEYNLYLQEDVIATIDGDFTSDAKIGVKCRDAVDGRVFTDAISAANAKYFTSDSSDYVIVHDAAGLKLGTLATANGAAVNGTHVYALADAIAQAGATDRVALLSAITEDVAVAKSVYLDLNGQTGNTGTLNVTGGTLYLMDSANASYVDNGAKVNITDDGGEVARAFTTLSLKNAGNYTGNHRFLVIKTGGSYSAHRIYTAVKKNVLVPNKDGAVGITFRTELRCDETVAELIGSNYGVKAYAYANGEEKWNSGNKSYGEAVDAYGEAMNLNSKVALLGGVLRDAADGDTFTNDQRANWTWKGQAWFSFTDDIGAYTVTSAISSGKTLGQLIQAVNDQLATAEATPAQQTALGAMYTKWGGTMEDYGWDLTNIKKYAS